MATDVKKGGVEAAVIACRALVSGKGTLAAAAASLNNFTGSDLELVSLATRMPASRLRLLQSQAAQLVT